jgi:hypothetical protein
VRVDGLTRPQAASHPLAVPSGRPDCRPARTRQRCYTSPAYPGTALRQNTSGRARRRFCRCTPRVGRGPAASSGSARLASDCRSCPHTRRPVRAAAPVTGWSDASRCRLEAQGSWRALPYSCTRPTALPPVRPRPPGSHETDRRRSCQAETGKGWTTRDRRPETADAPCPLRGFPPRPGRMPRRDERRVTRALATSGSGSPGLAAPGVGRAAPRVTTGVGGGSVGATTSRTTVSGGRWGPRAAAQDPEPRVRETARSELGRL